MEFTDLLNQEASEYANKNVTNSLHSAFVDGANSNSVQIEKLKFAIDQLRKCADDPYLNYNYSKIGRKIILLQSELKKLES